MRFKWLNAFRPLFATLDAANRPLRRIANFGMGFCPGCERLRATASSRCTYCGSAAPVPEDA